MNSDPSHSVTESKARGGIVIPIQQDNEYLPILEAICDLENEEERLFHQSVFVLVFEDDMNHALLWLCGLVGCSASYGT